VQDLRCFWAFAQPAYLEILAQFFNMSLGIFYAAWLAYFPPLRREFLMSVQW